MNRINHVNHANPVILSKTSLVKKNYENKSTPPDSIRLNLRHRYISAATATITTEAQPDAHPRINHFP